MAAILENVSRRSILIGGAAVAGGLVIGLRFLPRGFASSPSAAPVDVPRFNPTAFVSIDETGLVTIVAHRSEMGQGIRTALPMAVADELEADWSRVRIVQAVGDEVTYGGQYTDGSRSLRHFLRPMREMGAAARQMLETAAADRWGVGVAQVRARNHQVVHTPTGRVLEYGALAVAASELPVPRQEQLKLKRPEDFRYIGKNVPIVDLNDMTSGRAGYGIDIRLPGMKYAVIARPPVYGGRVASYDERPALAVPGVERVLRLLLRSPHCARSHGATGRSGQCHRRTLRSVGVHPEPPRGTRRDRQGARDAGRPGEGERHASRRWLRPQVEARLRRGGRAALAGRRRSGQSDLDPRG